MLMSSGVSHLSHDLRLQEQKHFPPNQKVQKMVIETMESA